MTQKIYQIQFANNYLLQRIQFLKVNAQYPSRLSNLIFDHD